MKAIAEPGGRSAVARAAQPAGQTCNFPRGVAAYPENGHVFLAADDRSKTRA